MAMIPMRHAHRAPFAGAEQRRSAWSVGWVTAVRIKEKPFNLCISNPRVLLGDRRGFQHAGEASCVEMPSNGHVIGFA